MFRIGDVVRFQSADAGYKKFHLCVSHDGHFIYINSPRAKSFPGDLEIDESKITGVPPHPSKKSILSCTRVMQFTRDELLALRAKQTGRVTADVLRRLYLFVENLPTLAPETREPILDGLGEWI